MGFVGSFVSDFIRIILFLSFVLSFLGTVSFTTAAPRKGSSLDCSSYLVGKEGVPVAEMAPWFEEYSLLDLVSSDPEVNLALKFPMTVMNSRQRAYALLTYESPTGVLSPTYRQSRVTHFPMIHGGHPAAGGRMIVGQYEAVEQIMKYFELGASGSRTGRKFVIALGPAGTGKTEILQILTQLRARLPYIDRDYTELTFKWKNLDKIPNLADIFRGKPVENALQRSPFVLLPESVQDQLVAFARERVVDMVGFEPIPFGKKDPFTARIVQEIVTFYAAQKKVKSADARFVIEALNQHVVIVPRTFDPDAPAPIMRAQGKDPERNELFFGRNLSTLSKVSTRDALGYDYGGVVLRADGGVLGLDEFFRNEQDLRDLFLEIAENGVVSRGGAPPVEADLFLLGSSNTESIEDAKKNGQAKAQIDRTVKVPFRYSLHPLEILKTVLLMMGESNFMMVDLDQVGAEPQPADLNLLFPPPNDSGELVGADGRYAIYVPGLNSDEKPLLIAPRALTFMALTAAGTRLVTDSKAMEPYKGEIDLIRAKKQVATEETARLKVILGEHDVNNAVRVELSRMQDLLEEGDNGISQRNVETWLAEVIGTARKTGRTITPYMVDKVFLSLMDKDTFARKRDLRSRWLSVHNKVKQRFMLTYITRDLLSILGGDSRRLDSLYGDIKREILALSNDPGAVQFSDASGQPRPINHDRMREIKVVYAQINGMPLEYGEVKDFHASASKEKSKFPPLLDAIQRYLLRKEISTTGFNEYLAAFEGRESSSELRARIPVIERAALRMGYDRSALIEALMFVSAVNIEEQKRRRRR